MLSVPFFPSVYDWYSCSTTCAAIFFCNARQNNTGPVAGTKGRMFPVTMKDLTCEAWMGERNVLSDSCAIKKVADATALETWKDSNWSEARGSSELSGFVK